MKSERNDVQMSMQPHKFSLKHHENQKEPFVIPTLDWMNHSGITFNWLGEKEDLCEIFLVTSQVTSKSQNKRKGGSNSLHYSQAPDWNMVLHWKMTLKKKNKNCSASVKLQWLWRTASLFLSTNIFLAFRMQRGFWKSSWVSVHQLSQKVPFLHSSFANMIKAWNTMLCSMGHIWPTHCLFNSLLFLNHVHYEWIGRKCVNKNRKGCCEFINSDHLISCKLKCMNSILLNTRINLKNLYWLNLRWYALE